MRLAVLGAGDVDGDVCRPRSAGRSTVGQLGELLAEVVDPLVDLLVGGLGRVDRRPAARRSRRRSTSGRTSTTASNATSPSSSPDVMSISGGAMTSTSCSATASA